MSALIHKQEIDPGRVAVSVYSHKIPLAHSSLPCWSYVTEGLFTFGQKEYIFTLKRKADEDADSFPEDPIRLFQNMISLAQHGQIADEGGYSEFGPSTVFLGRSGVQGLLYIRPTRFPEVSFNAPTLAAVWLTGDEINAYKLGGPTRVMALLGHHYKYFPCPPWSDREQESIANFHEMREKSTLSKTLNMRLVQSSLSIDDYHVTLRLPLNLQPGIATVVSQLPENRVISFITDFDYEANACLVWSSRALNDHIAIAAPNIRSDMPIRIAASFVTLLPEQKQDGAQQLEDGFVVWLKNSTWLSVREKLQKGEKIWIPAEGNLKSVSIIWQAEVPHFFIDPVSKALFYAEAFINKGFENLPLEIRPQGQSEDSVTSVTGIQLLDDDLLFKQRSKPRAMAEYVHILHEVVTNSYRQLENRFEHELVIQVRAFSNGNPEVTLAVQPDPILEKTFFDDIHKRLLAVPSIPITEGSLRFNVYFHIHLTKD